MSFFRRVAPVLLFVLLGSRALAQLTGNSPYSQLGIGDLNPPGFIANTAMGGTGVSYANGIFINNINPALLARNRNTIFDVGVGGQFKRITTSNASQQDVGGNLSYLAFAFPVSKKWTLSAGLRPYSSVDYEINTTGTVAGEGSPVSLRYTGSGGLTGVEFTNGFNIFKGLYAGVKATYVFGNITDESISQLYNDTLDRPTGDQVAYVTRTNHSDLLIQYGLAYRQKLRDKLFMNVGFVHDLAKDINGRRTAGFQPRDVNGSPLPINRNAFDTTLNNVKGNVSLPAQYKAGISLDSPFKWAVSADFSYQNWADFKDFDASETLENSYTLALGGEIIPDINSVSSYWKRITYRAGVNYTQLPLVINGEQINDIGITFGSSLPVSRGISDLNLAFTLGQRGTTSNNAIKEQYFKVSVGFTFNGFYDRWFIQNKID